MCTLFTNLYVLLTWGPHMVYMGTPNIFDIYMIRCGWLGLYANTLNPSPHPRDTGPYLSMLIPSTHHHTLGTLDHTSLCYYPKLITTPLGHWTIPLYADTFHPSPHPRDTGTYLSLLISTTHHHSLWTLDHTSLC